MSAPVAPAPDSTTTATLAFDVRLDPRKRLPTDDATQAHLIALAFELARRADRVGRRPSRRKVTSPLR
jgi:hypothetical protein